MPAFGIPLLRRAAVAAALALALAVVYVAGSASSEVSRKEFTMTTFIYPCTAEPVTIIRGSNHLVTHTTMGTIGLMAGNMETPGIVAVDSLTVALDRQTGAFTDNAKLLMLKTLTDAGWIAKGKESGLTAKTLTDAALGNADAIAVVNGAVLRATEENAAWVDSGKGVNQDLYAKVMTLVDLQAAITVSNEAVVRAREEWAAQAEVVGTVQQAQNNFTTALAYATDAVAANGAGLDKNTVAGAANQAALDKVNAAFMCASEAMKNSGASAGEMERFGRRAIPALVSTYEAMGMETNAARDLGATVINLDVDRQYLRDDVPISSSSH